MAILEAQLNMDMLNQPGQPLHRILLDLSTAYDTLDQMRTLVLLSITVWNLSYLVYYVISGMVS
jgi:hypothetical protein